MNPSEAAQPNPMLPARPWWPREHGAYAELLIPLFAAFAAGPTVAGLFFCFSGCAAFLAHEPALVLLGLRGTRAKREAGPRTMQIGAGLGAAFVIFGGIGFGLSSEARAGVLLPVALAGACAVLVVKRRERTLEGQVLTAAALASAAVPVALAGGVGAREAMASWALFGFAFALSTITVRGLTHRSMVAGAEASGAAPAAGHDAWILGAWGACGGVLLGLFLLKPILAIAILPLLGANGWIAATSAPVTELRRLGWVLAGATALSAILVIVALRV